MAMTKAMMAVVPRLVVLRRLVVVSTGGRRPFWRRRKFFVNRILKQLVKASDGLLWWWRWGWGRCHPIIGFHRLFAFTTSIDVGRCHAAVVFVAAFEQFL